MLPRSISSMYQVAPTTTSTIIDIASYFSRKTHFQLSDQRELVLCKFEEKSRRNKFLQISKLYEVAPKLLLQKLPKFRDTERLQKEPTSYLPVPTKSWSLRLTWMTNVGLWIGPRCSARTNSSPGLKINQTFFWTQLQQALKPHSDGGDPSATDFCGNF